MSRRPLGKLRIIGGEHRSRLVEFDADSGVRPTPDRVRQTVYDWLSPVIEGSRCLDLFAGSGALGLEAISRGAAHVSFVEVGMRQNTLIKAALIMLKVPAQRFDVAMLDAMSYLSQTWHRYNVVFIDPPYASGLLDSVLEELPKVLAPFNRIYIEWPEGKQPVLPANFSWLKEKKAGKVCYGLATYSVEKP
ncbi:MAG: 16S rRNA (guanine(966)-N(2))-methyltransferase RsmD [Cupriavidus sp.]|nr:MAG: 16S rRNA (guanine(966)-N(2))-methyltransferase RsmD [Cupriavidus sp.]